MKDCVFCKIVKGKAPANIEEESKLAMAFSSIDPKADVHIIIVPKKHIGTFRDLEPASKDTLFEMVVIAQKLIKEKSCEKAYRMVFNGGDYQAIPHLHWHLLGGKVEGLEET